MIIEIDNTIPVIQLFRALSTEGLALKSVSGELRIERTTEPTTITGIQLPRGVTVGSRFE